MLRLDINLLFTVINLLVLYFFMRKFLFGRVNKILEERKALIEKQFADDSGKFLIRKNAISAGKRIYRSSGRAGK